MLASAEVMAVFGDAVAWWKMPKYDDIPAGGYEGESPHALRDLGYELIPFYCPLPSPESRPHYTVVLQGSELV